MSLLLNIDTTSETAFVSIAKDGRIISQVYNENAREHASFLHPAIGNVIGEVGISLHDLDAIAVNHGPGSYTGIRVGMAAASGCCFALRKPMIVVNALEIIAHAVLSDPESNSEHEPYNLVCPMIDARRMEVFTAVYDRNMTCIQPPQALVLDQHSWTNLLESNRIVFAGNGSSKWQFICNATNARFKMHINTTFSMAQLSYMLYLNQKNSGSVKSEALYVKEFYSGHNPA